MTETVIDPADPLVLVLEAIDLNFRTLDASFCVVLLAGLELLIPFALWKALLLRLEGDACANELDSGRTGVLALDRTEDGWVIFE